MNLHVHSMFKTYARWIGILILGAMILSACQTVAAQPAEPSTTSAPQYVEPGPTLAPPPAEPSPTSVPKPVEPSPTSAPKPAEPGPTSAPPPSAATTVPANPPAAVAPGEATINIATDAKLGKYLVGNNGMALYMYTVDGPDQSNCKGDCLVKWPPLLTLGKPVLGEGVDPSLIGTATLDDGSKIVTYNKMPLYYWFKDTKPGDTTGQGVGSVWYVVSPDGQPVK